MKKNVLKGILLLSVLLITACKSTDIEEKQDEGVKNKNYVGWVDSTGKDVVYKDGIVQIKVKQNLGTFNIGVVNENGKVIPVLSTSEEFTTSAFYLKTSKKLYTLRNDGNIQTSATRKKNSVALNYYLDKAFDVSVNFETMESGELGTADMIKVTYKVTNLGAKKDEFSLKAVFDTVLGETDRYHFYTSENLPVKNEVAYRTMQNQKWFVSKNKSAAMQFILNGADTTAPDLVALANYSTFQKNSWEPEMLTYRAFDNVLSYNNSAVGILWPVAKVKPMESYKNIFYISLAADGEEPAGHKLIFKPEPEEETEKVDLGPEKQNLVVEDAIESEEELPLPPPVKTKKAENMPMEAVEVEPLAEAAELPVKAEPLVEDKIEEISLPPEPEKTVKDDRLTNDYIQNLIDRITELESDTSKTNTEELQLLNDELDEILSALR